MANPEHLAILKEGTTVWNEWQREHRDVVPDLDGADLGGMYLRGARLVGAKLRAANLRHVDFSMAILSNASLAMASLYDAVFIDTLLDGTDLSYVHLANCIFSRVDLSETKGLDWVWHLGPCTIGIDMIYESRGNIPDAFLRGCGAPDSVIDYARSLGGKPIEYYSCFISHAGEDLAFAKRLHRDLQDAHVRCWLDDHDLKTGDRLEETFDRAIRVHDKLVVVLSSASIASEWVEDEVNTAMDRERDGATVLFPIRIDDALKQPPTRFHWANRLYRHRRIGDFRGWKDHYTYHAAFDSLLRDLKQEPAAAGGAP